MCIVSASVPEFTTTLKAYHRVMDLKKQHRDPVSLHIMVNFVIDHAGSEEAEKLRPKVRELFARIASQDGRDSRVWTIYAQLLASDEDQSPEMRHKVLQCLSKAHHCIATPGWESNNAHCKHVLLSALELVHKALLYDISYTSAQLAVRSVKAVLEVCRDAALCHGGLLSIVQHRRSAQLEEFNDEVRVLLQRIDEADVALAGK